MTIKHCIFHATLCCFCHFHSRKQQKNMQYTSCNQLYLPSQGKMSDNYILWRVKVNLFRLKHWEILNLDLVLKLNFKLCRISKIQDLSHWTHYVFEHWECMHRSHTNVIILNKVIHSRTFPKVTLVFKMSKILPKMLELVLYTSLHRDLIPYDVFIKTAASCTPILILTDSFNCTIN